MSYKLPGKSAALIAYTPFVGFLISFFINQEDKHEFATWHIKNMFGIFILFLISVVIMSNVNVTGGDIMWFATFILWIYCWIMASKNKKKGIPYLSDRFQEWFVFLD